MQKGRESAVTPRAIDTLIGAGTQVSGKISATGTLRIDGQVDGEIETEGDVVVGESGRISAQVTAGNLTVAGEIQGDVVVRGRLELVPTGRLLGNARTNVLIIEEGAVFRGECDMLLDEGGRRERVKQALPNSEAEKEVSTQAS